MNSSYNYERCAVILAGGYGTRLRDAGFDLPKPMVPIDGKPVLEHQIELCKQYGFKQIYIITHHQSEKIKEYLNDGKRWDVSICYLEEAVAKGTAGALAEFIHHLPDQFILLYGDTYLNVNLSRMFDFHLSNSSVATIMVHPNNHPSDSDIIEIDEKTNLVKNLSPYPHENEKPLRNCVNAALYCINRKKIKRYLVQGLFSDIAKHTFPKIIDAGENILSYKTFEYIKDMGTPERLIKVQSDIKINIPQKLSFSKKRVAVFLDRDGTINTECGLITNLNQLELINDAALSIKRLNDAGLLVFCVTNQPVIARGDITEQELNRIHAKLDTELGLQGAYLDELFFCPHHPDKGYPGEVANLKIKCSCRKPEPGLILSAMNKYNLSESSYFIGDTTTDIFAAQKAGITSILLSTGYAGKDGKVAVSPDYKCNTLTDAVDLILKREGA